MLESKMEKEVAEKLLRERPVGQMNEVGQMLGWRCPRNTQPQSNS